MPAVLQMRDTGRWAGTLGMASQKIREHNSQQLRGLHAMLNREPLSAHLCGFEVPTKDCELLCTEAATMANDNDKRRIERDRFSVSMTRQSLGPFIFLIFV